MQCQCCNGSPPFTRTNQLPVDTACTQPVHVECPVAGKPGDATDNKNVGEDARHRVLVTNHPGPFYDRRRVGLIVLVETRIGVGIPVVGQACAVVQVCALLRGEVLELCSSVSCVRRVVAGGMGSPEALALWRGLVRAAKGGARAVAACGLKRTVPCTLPGTSKTVTPTA